jgi:hypothetical protein
MSPYQLGLVEVGPANQKVGLALPQTATANLFQVINGAVLVTSMLGVVTTAIGATVTSLSLGLAPSIGTANTAGIGGPSVITSLAAGTTIAPPSAAGSGGVSLVAPSVPASTVAVVNNYRGSVDVTLSAFTLTAVFVNGVQVGTTNATYTVPAHGTISVTYSVVGTWTWAGSVALEIAASGPVGIPKDFGFIASPGFITWTTTANDTGVVKWYISYIPFDQGAVLKGARVL